MPIKCFVQTDPDRLEYRDTTTMNLSREGGLPARILGDGTQEWWKNGQRTRDGDLPSIIYADGTICFYKENRLHRDGGKPAIIYPDGPEVYYNHGTEISREEAQEMAAEAFANAVIDPTGASDV
jgi:hypothetical protein